MARCIELAAHGAGSVAPNPMVGAVLVYDGQIIGEGYHRCYGGAHAEVNAINAVRDEQLLRRSTLYVSLEPCSHYGKTPPCAELLIRKGIPRVVVACADPFPEVSGRGIRMLREAGAEVIVGVLEKEALWLNRYFITAQTKRRPYVILKWAQSADGFIDRRRALPEDCFVPHDDERDCFVPRNDGVEAGGGVIANAVKQSRPVKLSSSLTRMEVHKLRSEVQAIMVGTRTALLDNPSLTVHHWAGRSPLRVVIDRHGRIPQSFRLFDGKSKGAIVTGSQPTLVFTSDEIYKSRDAFVTNNVKKAEDDVEYETAANLEEILTILYERKIYSLLVEGGAMLHQSFFDAGLWDELAIETAPVMLHDGVAALDIRNAKNLNLYENKRVPSFLKEGESASKTEKYYKLM